MRQSHQVRLLKIAKLLNKVSVNKKADSIVPLRPLVFVNKIDSLEKYIEALVVYIRKLATQAKDLDSLVAKSVGENLSGFAHDLEYTEIIPNVRKQLDKVRQK